MLTEHFEFALLAGVLGPFAVACGVTVPTFSDSSELSIVELAELRRKYSGLLIVFNRFRDRLIASDSWSDPAEDEWSIREILGHLVDTDKQIWWPRIGLMLESERPHLQSVDQVSLLTRNRWNEQPVERILAQFMQFRWNCAIRIKDLTLQDFARTGIHYEFGEISVANILEVLIAHDAHYLGKLRARLEIPEF
jgi:hypothetical protein